MGEGLGGGGGALPPICGAIKLVPIGFLPITAGPGITKAAMTCVREFGHPEANVDSSLHLCGTFAWKVGANDDERERCQACREGVPPEIAPCLCPTPPGASADE